MLWKHPTNIPRPRQQPKKRRHYYECDCGSNWSMVFETGDGKPRTRKCFRCKKPNTPVRTYHIPE